MAERRSKSTVSIRVAFVVVAVALLGFVALEAAHWPDDQQRAWNTGGAWFVFSWILAVLTVISTAITFLNPALAWTSATFGAIGICMIVVAAAKATSTTSSTVYIPLLY